MLCQGTDRQDWKLLSTISLHDMIHPYAVTMLGQCTWIMLFDDTVSDHQIRFPFETS